VKIHIYQHLSIIGADNVLINVPHGRFRNMRLTNYCPLDFFKNLWLQSTITVVVVVVVVVVAIQNENTQIFPHL